jgi:hypothetical protein
METLYGFLFSPMRTTCHDHRIFQHMIILIIFGEEHKLIVVYIIIFYYHITSKMYFGNTEKPPSLIFIILLSMPWIRSVCWPLRPELSVVIGFLFQQFADSASVRSVNVAVSFLLFMQLLSSLRLVYLCHEQEKFMIRLQNVFIISPWETNLVYINM